MCCREKSESKTESGGVTATETVSTFKKELIKMVIKTCPLVNSLTVHKSRIEMTLRSTMKAGSSSWTWMFRMSLYVLKALNA